MPDASLFALLALLSPFAPQDPAPAALPTALPAAGSDAANAMLLRACSTMTAVTSGAFTTDTETDMAMIRGQGLPIGEQKAHLEGGWDQQQRWARTDDDTFVIRGGRMVAEGERGWMLRGSQLPSGASVPFVLQPRLLFAQLAELPARARKVVHVEGGKVGEREVAILTLRLVDQEAEDLALGGALPSGSGGGGSMFVIGGLFGGGQRPQQRYSVDLALFTALDNGQVLRLRAKVYEDNPLLQNMRIRIGGAGGQREDDREPEDEKAADEATDPDKIPIKKGLPEREPARTETMYYLRAEFSDFGQAKAPEIDANGLRWLTEN